MSDKEANEYLTKVATILAENFDAVQISASRLLPEGSTKAYHRGSGNFFARIALCQQFVHTDQAGDQATLIAEKLDERKE